MLFDNGRNLKYFVLAFEPSMIVFNPSNYRENRNLDSFIKYDDRIHVFMKSMKFEISYLQTQFADSQKIIVPQ